MADWSRRRALHAVGTATAVALAGCSGDTRERDSRRSRRGDPVTDYDLRKVRDSDGGPLFWSDERPAADDGIPGGYAYIGSTSELAEVSFASGSEAAQSLASFVGDTDFEAAAVLLQARGISECYEARFRGLRRRSDGLHTSFCRRLRPADVTCRRDAEDTVGVALRVPFPDAEFTSFGSRWSGTCEPRPVGVEGATDSSNGGGGA
jgi:hypothetical protein